MNKIVVVDYGMGNLRSVAKALQVAAPKAHVLISSQAADITQADRIVLPGQGAMPDCMAGLRDMGLYDAMVTAARTKPLLGICIGEQMLFDWSEEGASPGLGLLPGKVQKFDLAKYHQADGLRYKVPHMGWNSVEQVAHHGLAHSLWRGIPNNSYFYFVHSYYVNPDRACDVVGVTPYGHSFVSAVACDNLFATQFHPEKSARLGLQLFENFALWNP